MKICVADFETTNFPELNTHPGYSRQPEVVSMGLILADISDVKTVVTSEYYAIVEHNRTSTPEAEDVHGISKGYADKHGIDKESAAGFLDCFTSQADIFVAHNVAFDLFMAKAALAQADFDFKHLDSMASYCTMKQARNLTGTGKYNLTYSLRHFCSIKRAKDQHHNAMDDARGCLELFRHFRARGCGPVIG